MQVCLKYKAAAYSNNGVEHFDFCVSARKFI